MAGDLKPCCADPANRSEPERVQDDLQLTRCKVCDRRHFELTIDPGLLALRST